VCSEKENFGILKYENRQVGRNYCEFGKPLVLRSKTVKSLVKQEIIPVRLGTGDLGGKRRVDYFQPKECAVKTGNDMM
jgi:hypothetical protein